MDKLFYEEVIRRYGENITISNVRIATQIEIDGAKALHAKGKCPHTIIKDEEGWPYDFRNCAICGKGLGLV